MIKKMEKEIKEFMREEDAVGVVEIILILVILVALIVLFRTQITTIVKNAFSTIKTDAGTINGKIKID